MARGTECAAHMHESLEPLERHHIQPLSRGGPNVKSNLVTICGNAHGNVHYLLSAIERVGGYENLDGAVKRTYGYGVRRIALAGWAEYRDAFLAGDLWRELELWTSDGQPTHPNVPPYGWAVHIASRMLVPDPATPEAFSYWAREYYRRASRS